MGNNALPANTGDLTKLGNKMVGGLTALGKKLGITQMTAASLQAQLDAFGTAQTAFNSARDARQAATSACTKAHGDIYDWLLNARSVLVPYLGRTWSAAWAAAGFVNSSTAVPATVGDQFKLIGLLAACLTKNPKYEDPEVGVTGAAGTTLKDKSIEADSALSEAVTASTMKKDERDAALADLRGAMRMLIGILDELLAPDDPRWATFGLNQPDADTTPAAPENLTASIADGPVILAACDPVPLAQRYRWRIKVVGLDADYRLAASTKSPLAQIDKALPGQTVELIVQAANQSAQSLPSESVTVTLGIPAVPSPAVGAPSVPREAKAGGNGNGNGRRRKRRVARARAR